MADMNAKLGLIPQMVTSLRIGLATMGICSLIYPMLILIIGRGLVPDTADGALIRDDHGQIVGSESIAQRFSRPEYFWPRPSAVNYNAAAAGGSNLSPSSPELRERVISRLSKIQNGGTEPIPVDLLTASGSGLDPHITLKAAIYQAERVASVRGISIAAVTSLLEMNARRSGGGLSPECLVNVLLVNLALDRMKHEHDLSPG